MPFNELLDKLLEERGAASRLSLAVGLSRQQVANVRAGLRKPDLEHIEKWADALDLPRNSRDREKFIRLAYLAHAPVEVSRLVDDLERQLAHRGEQVVQLVAELRRRGVKIPESCRDF